MKKPAIQHDSGEFERSAARFEARKQEQLRQIRAGKLSVKEADRRNFALAAYVDCKITVR